MIYSVKAGGSAQEASFNQRSTEREPAQQQPKEDAPALAEASKPGSDLRLVIERDSDDAYYVYRLIDRITGKVVAELPRDQVSDLASSPSYAAGGLVSTKA